MARLAKSDNVQCGGKTNIKLGLGLHGAIVQFISGLRTPCPTHIHRRRLLISLQANITYVDFFAIPIALTLYTNNAAKPQHVSGTNENGLNQVVAGMREQHAKDGQGWDQLVKNGPNGQPIRVVSPNVGISMNGALFRDYFTSYVTQVWTKFRNQDMTINTQASYGNRTGRVVANGFLSFTQAPGAYFRKPTAADIFSCSTGPFATNENQERNAIIPRLAAAFNRTTLLLTNQFPNGSTSSQFYTQNPTNHYSRVVHGANLDRRGYAFPYDDVTRDGGIDNSGSVFGPPSLLIVSIGGNGAGLASAPRVPIG